MSKLPELAFGTLPAPPAASPPLGTVQFFDGYFPALAAGSYTISLTHTLEPGTANQQQFSTTQDFVVQAPEFSIDAGLVQSVYPPPGASSVFGQVLPSIVLADPALPWARSLEPAATSLPGPSDTTPWLALLVFADGEVVLQPGTSSPVQTITVADFLDPGATLLAPQLSTGWVPSAVQASQCQTVTVTGAAFTAVAPYASELPFLAHCRGVGSATEGQVLLAVLLANRLAVNTGQAALRYYAHLVSLEGFSSYLAAGATLPTMPGTDTPVNVQLISLYNWTFLSLPQPSVDFEQLMAGLVASQGSTPSLQLPPGRLAAVSGRLSDGYAPLAFAAGAGDETFAWYRGPLTAVVPQAVDATAATSSDELMIYVAEQGLFDLSYAAAWNLGRSLALADAHFGAAIDELRFAARRALATLAQRLALPHLAGDFDAAALLARDTIRARFASRVGEGLGGGWTAALRAARQGDAPPAPSGARRTRPPRRRRAIHPRSLLAVPGVPAALTINLQATSESVAKWLAKLSLLEPVPFSHLVPNPAMLPVESIRFFYVDQGWIDALVAGAMSLALQTAADRETFTALAPALQQSVARHRRRLAARPAPPGATAATRGGESGMLIRSQLVAGWPDLVVAPTLGGAPLTLLRNDVPSPNVRLCLFDGIPDTVTLAEPYRGLHFGVEDGGTVVPRCVTAPAAAGAQLANASSVTIPMRDASAGNGVVDFESTPGLLEAAAGVTIFGSDSVVNWNVGGSSTQLTTKFVDAGELQAAVPADLLVNSGTTPVQVEITVTTGGVSSAPATFLVNPAFVLDSVEPALIPAGGEAVTLTLLGAGFSAGSTVQWTAGGTTTPLTTAFVSAAQLTATVPLALLTTGPVSIAVSNGTPSTNSLPLSVVTDDPVIGGIEPTATTAGGSGLTLTVEGNGFGAAAVVQWNGAALLTTVVSSSELSAAVPTSLLVAGSVAVTVASGGATSNAATFTVAGAVPVIVGVEPTAAVVSTTALPLTVDGFGFASGAVVQADGTALSPPTGSSTRLTASLVPSAAGTIEITVASGGATSNEVPLTVVGPQPVIGLLVPSSAVAGGLAFTLTVYGGFGAGDLALQLVQAPEAQSFAAG